MSSGEARGTWTYTFTAPTRPRRSAPPSMRSSGRRCPRGPAAREISKPKAAPRCSAGTRRGAARLAASGLARGSGPLRLDSARCDELHLPPAHGSARRGARRRHLLPPVLGYPAPARGRACVRRHRVPHQGQREVVRRTGGGARPRRQRSVAAQPVSGAVRTRPAALVIAAGEVPEAGSFTLASSEGVTDALAHPESQEITTLEALRRSTPQAGAPGLQLIQRIGVVDPGSLNAYRDTGGYDALRKAVALGAEGVVREVTASKLMGRGGAAFPTGRKWDAVAKRRRARTSWCATRTSPNRAPSKTAS